MPEGQLREECSRKEKSAQPDAWAQRGPPGEWETKNDTRVVQNKTNLNSVAFITAATSFGMMLVIVITSAINPRSTPVPRDTLNSEANKAIIPHVLQEG